MAYADTVKRDEASLNAFIAGIRNTRLHEKLGTDEDKASISDENKKLKIA